MNAIDLTKSKSLVILNIVQLNTWNNGNTHHGNMLVCVALMELLVSLTQFKVHPQKMILAHYIGPIQNGP